MQPPEIAAETSPDWALKVLRSGWLPAAIGAICYLFSLGGGFVRDDPAIIETNPRVKELMNWRAIWLTDWWATYVEPGATAPSPLRDRLYRPLSLFTFAVQYSLHGMTPWAFHLANVLMHALMCQLVWRLTHRVIDDPAIASIAALIFAVHPIHAEAVCELVGRAEILVAIALASGLLAATPASGLPSIARTFGASLAFFLALLAKESAICYAPFLVALWVQRCERFAGSGFWRGVLVRVPILLLPIIGYFSLRYFALEGQLIRPELTSVLLNPLKDTTLLQHLNGVLIILGNYARLMLTPVKLSSDYSYAIVDPRGGMNVMTLVGATVAVGSFMLAGRWLIAALRWRSGATPSVYGLLAVLFLSSYALISNVFVLIGVSLAERLFYWPSVPVCIALGIFVMRAMRSAATGRGALAWQLALTVGLIFFAGRAALRSLDWRSPYELYRSDHETYPRNARNAQNYGRQLNFMGSQMPKSAQRESWLAQADQALATALAVHPNYPQALQQRGLNAELRGETIKAIQYYEMALQFGEEPTSTGRLNALRGGGSAAEGKLAELERRIGANSNDIDAHIEAGRLMLAQRNGSRAFAFFEAAAKAAPDHAAAIGGCAQALLIQGQRDAAIPYLEKAIELDPRDWRSHTNLMAVTIRSNPVKALKHAKIAVELQPGDFTALANCAEAYVANNDKQAALRCFNDALRILPADDPNRASIEARIAQVQK